MANSKSLLPPSNGKAMLLSPATYEKLVAIVDLLQTDFDTRDFVTQLTSRGKRVRLRSVEEILETIKAGSANECPLGTLTKNAGDDNYSVVPGYVFGGGDSFLLEKNDITAAIGSELYIEVSWTANAIDDVLQAGGTMTAAVLVVGAKPVDDVLSATSLTGKHYRTLGEWVDDGDGGARWVPDACGSYTVRFCPSGWTGIRGADGGAGGVEDQYY